MKLNLPTILVALAMIGAGGFIAGRVSSPAPRNSSENSPTGTRGRIDSGSGSASETPDGRKSARATRPERGAGAGSMAKSADRLSKLEPIVRGENSLERTRALLALIDQLSPGDFEAAVANFRNLGMTDQRMGEYSLLLTAWAAADPLKALEYAKENTREGFATDTILSSWAAKDPDAAVQWAKANFDGTDANPYLAGIIRGISASDPARASELLASMPRSEERAKGLDAFLPHLLQQGTDATRSWIEGLSDEALKNGAMMRVANELANADPAGTASWLMSHPGEAQQRRMDDVYSAWAQKDQQAALNSLNSLPAGEARTNALRGVITSIATEDPKAAVGMLDRYANDVNDRVVQSVIWHTFGSDPILAASQISRIGNEGERNRMYERAIGNWMENDPGSAQAWMASNPLPEAVLKRLNKE